MSAEQVRRRYLLLTASRWLPTGLLIPLITIVPLQRGLSLTQIGTLTAIGGVVVLALELPTGGLSDALGRRPVLLAAAAFSIVSTTGLALAGSFAVFAVAFAVEGIYRALDSGPLDAWYVDTALAADAHADIETGLSRHATVIGAAVAVGALTSGALALLPTPAALPALALPLLCSAGLRAVDAVLLVVLVREDREPRRRLRSTVTDSGRTVREAVALLAASTPLLALVASEALWGAGMVAVEVFTGPRLVDLLDDAGQGVGVLAVAAALGWAASSAGAAAAPWLARRTGSWVAAAVLTRSIQAVAVLGAGLLAGPAGLLAGYLGFYLVHGAANVAHTGLLHRNVGPAHRATMVSVNSMGARFGGVLSAPLLGLLADGAGLPVVFVTAAVLLGAGAPLYLLARPRFATRPTVPAH